MSEINIFRTRFTNVRELTGNTIQANDFYLGVSGRSVNNVFVHSSGSTINGDINIVGNLSANTLYSGDTDLYNIFATIGTLYGGSGNTTFVQPGSNISTGGSINYPVINVIDSPSFLNLNVSGTSFFNSISSTTISATTVIFSGGSNLETIINTIVSNSIYSLSGGGDMFKAQNLSGLTNYQLARNNLGLGDLEYRTDTPKKYKEFIYSGDNLSQINIWEDETMIVKLYQTDYIYSGNNLIQTTVQRIVDSYTYSKYFTYDVLGNLLSIDVQVI